MALDVLLGIALVLGVMILVHELGHFIAARAFGVRVEVFSIGFGPRLFGWRRGPTDYRVSALPLGGYVRMAGQDPTEVDSGEHRPTGANDELMSKPRWQRAIISFAGPAVNLLFPIILLVGFYVIKGDPYPAFWDLPVQVVALPGAQQSNQAGLRVGDKVLSIDGVQNPTWEQVEKIISNASPTTLIPVEVENNGERRKENLTLSGKDNDTATQTFGYPPIPPVIDDVVAGAPADRAGLAPGDKVIGVNGQEIRWWGEFQSLSGVGFAAHRAHPANGAPVNLKIARKNQIMEVSVTPEKTVLPQGETVYLIGLGPKEKFKYRSMPFTQAVSVASERTYETVEDTIGIVGKLFSGRVSVKQLQGAVGISRAAGQAVRKGPLAVVSLMVLISVNLGILNLLPIPILDGGHILLLAIEGSMRRDLSMAFKERFVQVGLVFLLVLFAYVMYNDVVRLLPIHS
jgi:regulator of sigma E protease